MTPEDRGWGGDAAVDEPERMEGEGRRYDADIPNQ